MRRGREASSAKMHLQVHHRQDLPRAQQAVQEAEEAQELEGQPDRDLPPPRVPAPDDNHNDHGCHDDHHRETYDDNNNQADDNDQANYDDQYDNWAAAEDQGVHQREQRRGPADKLDRVQLDHWKLAAGNLIL